MMMNVAIALSIVLCWLSHTPGTEARKAHEHEAHEAHEVRDVRHVRHAKEAHIPHMQMPHMPMPRAIVHIGPQKTATTTVQDLVHR
jgi:hypothetical protein